MKKTAAEMSPTRSNLHMVARLHYESDLSQIEIARRLGVSGATVSRLLRRARDEGIVRIEVQDLIPRDNLSRELVKRLGLKAASLSEGASTSPLTELAEPVGELLKTHLKSGAVLAVGWGRAIREVLRTGLPRIPGTILVPATGGMQQPAPHFQINEFVRLAAEQMGGEPRFIHAPYLVSRPARNAFLNDPMISDQFALWGRIDVAMVGIGMPHAVDPIYAAAATANERAMRNVAGDVIRHYFDFDGKILSWTGGENLIAVSVKQLQAAPLVIGVAIGPEKSRAIVGAARAKVINALVTNVATAQAVLELA